MSNVDGKPIRGLIDEKNSGQSVASETISQYSIFIQGLHLLLLLIKQTYWRCSLCRRAVESIGITTTPLLCCCCGGGGYLLYIFLIFFGMLCRFRFIFFSHIIFVPSIERSIGPLVGRRSFSFSFHFVAHFTLLI